jgi:prepilin-type N-terminal cleavage/methylation domain-containing protein
MRENPTLPEANIAGDQRRFRPSDASGFSLIELLVVLLLMVVLTTVYWKGSPASHQKQLKACQQNLEKVYLAMEIYSRDNHDKFPLVTGAGTSEEALDLLVPRYTSDTSIFICPATSALPLPGGESIRSHRISYAYYMGRRATAPVEILMSDKQVNTDSKNKGDTLFSSTGRPPGNNHETHGGNLLFSDGSVETARATAPTALVLTQNVVLLNPKP